MTVPLDASGTAEKLRLQIQKPIADPTSPSTTPYVERVMDTLLAAADRNLGAISSQRKHHGLAEAVRLARQLRQAELAVQDVEHACLLDRLEPGQVHHQITDAIAA